MRKKDISNFIRDNPVLFSLIISFGIHTIFFLSLHFSSKSRIPAAFKGAVRVKLVAPQKPSAYYEEKKGFKIKNSASSKGSSKTQKSVKQNKRGQKKIVKKKSGVLTNKPGSDILSILNEVSAKSSKPEVTKGLFSAGGIETTQLKSTKGETLNSRIWKEYVSGLWEKVKNNWTPPPGRAQMAVVVVSINKKGLVQNINLEVSSGSPAFDRRAIEAIKSSVPFPPPPEDKDIEIGFRFKVEK